VHGFIFYSDSNPIIINNIFCLNSNSGLCADSEPTLIEYNLFWLNGVDATGNSLPENIGIITGVNGNGNEADTYMNLFMDPLFNSPELGDYSLTSESPCIDAGNPLPEYFDPDGTIADIGAYYYFQSGFTHDYGDVDDNGDIEAIDASLVLQYFCLLVPEGTTLPWEVWRIDVADVDGNEVVEAYDASLILRFSVGLIDEFPVENVRLMESINE